MEGKVKLIRYNVNNIDKRNYMIIAQHKLRAETVINMKIIHEPLYETFQRRVACSLMLVGQLQIAVQAFNYAYTVIHVQCI